MWKPISYVAFCSSAIRRIVTAAMTDPQPHDLTKDSDLDAMKPKNKKIVSETENGQKKLE